MLPCPTIDCCHLGWCFGILWISRSNSNNLWQSRSYAHGRDSHSSHPRLYMEGFSWFHLRLRTASAIMLQGPRPKEWVPQNAPKKMATFFFGKNIKGRGHQLLENQLFNWFNFWAFGSWINFNKSTPDWPLSRDDSLRGAVLEGMMMWQLACKMAGAASSKLLDRTLLSKQQLL